MRRLAAFLLTLACLLTAVSTAAVASDSPDLAGVVRGILAWKKASRGAAPDDPLLAGGLLDLAGSTAGDWYAVALGRLGIKDNQAGYLAVLDAAVDARYARPEKLDRAKATEWHRIALAALAAGGDPRHMGKDGSIDLIADGVYARTDEAGVGILGRQGINGFIWGLIALDSLDYPVPEDAVYTRDDLLLNLLARQCADGGWALAGETADPDITAMALQALAPYVNSEKCYPTAARPQGLRVREAVSSGLACLSALQNERGGFSSWGTENCESAAQVAVALASLGIDIFSDSRFVKNGHTVLDAILSFRQPDGGFLHARTYDAANPSALPGASNSMAGEQVMLALAAVARAQSGERRLWDFRAPREAALDAELAALDAEISSLRSDTPRAALEDLYARYLALPAGERSYVTAYPVLSDLLAAAGIPYAPEEADYRSGDAGASAPMEEFTAADRAAVDALPHPLTTASRAEVLRLWRKLQNSFDFEGREDCLRALDDARAEISRIEGEIEALGGEIRETLYPTASVTLADRRAVKALYARYLALSEYDRAALEPADVEQLMRCLARVDTQGRALLLGGGAALLAAAVAAGTVWHVRRRRAEAAMPESEDT